ncbi:MAG: hypothetical protein H8E14_13045 [Candidatus Marinimicrobia bacterium]|nr:hypothetical protein [Candidatus Neomarinimicrobiota bacterium]
MPFFVPPKKDSTKTVLANRKSTSIGKVDTIADGESEQTVITGTVNIGITLEQHEASLRRQERRLRAEIRTAVETEEREKRDQLKIKLSDINDKLLNLRKSFNEEQKRLKSACAGNIKGKIT